MAGPLYYFSGFLSLAGIMSWPLSFLKIWESIFLWSAPMINTFVSYLTTTTWTWSSILVKSTYPPTMLHHLWRVFLILFSSFPVLPKQSSSGFGLFIYFWDLLLWFSLLHLSSVSALILESEAWMLVEWRLTSFLSEAIWILVFRMRLGKCHHMEIDKSP